MITYRKDSSKTKSSKKEKAKGVTSDGNSSSKNNSGIAVKEKVDVSDSNSLKDGDSEMISTEGSVDGDGKFDWWSEVYLPEEKRWICEHYDNDCN